MVDDRAKIECRLVQAWILADKFQDTITTNMVMDGLLNFYQQNSDFAPLNRAIIIVAKNTTAESPLRKLFIEAISHEGGFTTFKHICGSGTVPKAFVCDVLWQVSNLEIARPNDKVIEVFDPSFVSKQERCRYHQHDKTHPTCGERCEKKVGVPDRSGE